MQKYATLSLASFRPKSDKERKGRTKNPFLLDATPLWVFSRESTTVNWEKQYFYLVGFQQLINTCLINQYKISPIGNIGNA